MPITVGHVLPSCIIQFHFGISCSMLLSLRVTSHDHNLVQTSPHAWQCRHCFCQVLLHLTQSSGTSVEFVHRAPSHAWDCLCRFAANLGGTSCRSIAWVVCISLRKPHACIEYRKTVTKICENVLQEQSGGSLLAPHMHIKPLLFPVDNFICIGTAVTLIRSVLLSPQSALI